MADCLRGGPIDSETLLSGWCLHSTLVDISSPHKCIYGWILTFFTGIYSSDMDKLPHKESDLEPESLMYWKPVKVGRICVMWSRCRAPDTRRLETSRGVLYWSQPFVSVYSLFQPVEHYNSPVDSELILGQVPIRHSLSDTVGLLSANCGEMTSPSPLKNLHKLVRLLGWTSPFSHAWLTQKTESVRNWLSPWTHVLGRGLQTAQH